MKCEDRRQILPAGLEGVPQGQPNVLGSHPNEVNWGEELRSAAFPGRNWQNCPVIVVEQSSAPPSLEALTDSMVALALEMGLRPWQVDDRQLTWGERLYPAGLAAWDARVI